MTISIKYGFNYLKQLTLTAMSYPCLVFKHLSTKLDVSELSEKIRDSQL